MDFVVVTLFPEYFRSPTSLGVVGRAIERGLIRLRCLDPRDWTTDRHRQADDYAFGGGPGMVLKPEPLAGAIRAAREAAPGAIVLATSPGGRRLDDAWARELASGSGLILVCGRYEGVDQRVIDHYCDGEISAGDFVLSGGEPAALCVVDAVSRHVPGVVGKEENVAADSFSAGLKWPVYTRPEVFEGRAVPPVLLSGDEAAVAAWRRDAALRRTAEGRPERVVEAGRHRIGLELVNLDSKTAVEIARWTRGLVGLVVYASADAAERAAFRTAMGEGFARSAHPSEADERLAKSLGPFTKAAVDGEVVAALRRELAAGRSIVLRIDAGADPATFARLGAALA